MAKDTKPYRYSKDNKCSDCGKAICNSSKKCGSCSRVGRVVSEESKIKMSNVRKNKNFVELFGEEKANEYRKNQSMASYGKKLSEEHRGNLSKARSKLVEEGNLIIWNKGLTKKEDNRLKISGETQTKTKKELFENGEIKIWNKGLTKKTDDRVRKNTERRIKTIVENGSLMGSNNGRWLGGISFEPYDDTFNEQFKITIRKRDNHSCVVCSVNREELNRELDVHHINYNKLISMPQNCVSLCASCHSKTNFNRDHWTVFFQSFLSEKHGYEYSVDGEIKLILEVKNGSL